MALTLRKFVPSRPATQSDAQMADRAIGIGALDLWGGIAAASSPTRRLATPARTG